MDNVIQAPMKYEQHPMKNYGKTPKGRFPSGTIPAFSVKVDMAVGMYQFHDLLSSHVSPDERSLMNNHDEINDNTPSDFGLINMG